MKKTQITKKIALVFAATGIILFTSCKEEADTDAAEPGQTENTSTTENAEDNQTVQVNPAHGLPGHRCDLPVGAPLTSARSTIDEATPQAMPASSVSPVRIDQTPKVNPPHGQPGHDCTVPVGAELN